MEMHLFTIFHLDHNAPCLAPNFAEPLSSITLWTTVLSRRNCMEAKCEILGGKQGAKLSIYVKTVNIAYGKWHF